MEYQGGQDATATITGVLKDVRSHEVVRLYAQAFPYTGAPVAVESLTAQPAGGVAKYAFGVTPAIATRYHVQLFPNGTGATPLATSVTATV